MYKKKSKETAIWILLMALIVIIILFGVYYILKSERSETADSKKLSAESTVTTVITQEPVVITSVARLELSEDELYSSNAILMRDDGVVLYEKNSSDKMYPASLTKMMTAIVALENIDDLDEKVSIPQEVFDYAAKEQASIAGFSPGVEITLRDMLYGLLLPSGAECSIGLADYVAGGTEAFTDKMNETAQRLGMENTNFTNPSGLHDDNLYSTAADIARLESYALDDPDFREIFTTKTYETTCGDGSIVSFSGTMFAAMESPEFEGGVILGGKTGFTDQAGLCLASLASIGDHEYILVTTHAEGNHTTEQYNVTDAFTVYKAAAKLYNRT